MPEFDEDVFDEELLYAQALGELRDALKFCRDVGCDWSEVEQIVAESG